MTSIINWSFLKKRVNSQGLRISRGCQEKLGKITEEAISRAIEKAKKEKAGQLRPDHFDSHSLWIDTVKIKD